MQANRAGVFCQVRIHVVLVYLEVGEILGFQKQKSFFSFPVSRISAGNSLV